MLSDRTQNIVRGNLSDGIEPDSSIKSVIEFIEEFIETFRIKNIGQIDTSEDTLNERLVIVFQRNIGHRPFFFKSEKIQNPFSGSSAKTDIGVLSLSETIKIHENTYGENEAFFEIECKRLTVLGKNREKEYVIGHDKPCGGMERFKRRIHGKGLKHAAIIGYVQRENFEFWANKINTWIDELIYSTEGEWLCEDKLSGIIKVDKKYVKLTSQNNRITNPKSIDKIKLLHIWVNLISKN